MKRRRVDGEQEGAGEGNGRGAVWEGKFYGRRPQATRTASAARCPLPSTTKPHHASHASRTDAAAARGIQRSPPPPLDAAGGTTGLVHASASKSLRGTLPCCAGPAEPASPRHTNYRSNYFMLASREEPGVHCAHPLPTLPRPSAQSGPLSSCLDIVHARRAGSVAAPQRQRHADPRSTFVRCPQPITSRCRRVC